MARYFVGCKLAGGGGGVGWLLVMFAIYAVIASIVFAIKNGDSSGFGHALQFLSYGLPMILVGAACRAVFEIADRPATWRPGTLQPRMRQVRRARPEKA